MREREVVSGKGNTARDRDWRETGFLRKGKYIVGSKNPDKSNSDTLLTLMSVCWLVGRSVIKDTSMLLS